MMFYTARGRRAGFTLIEIMIVIAIIAILAGIVVPNFMKARAESQLRACAQNVENLGTATAMWLARHSEGELYAYCSTATIVNGFENQVCNFDPGICSCSGLVSRVHFIKNVLVEQGYLASRPKCPRCSASTYMVSYNYYPLQTDGEVCSGWLVSCGKPNVYGTSTADGGHIIGDCCYHPLYVIGMGNVMNVTDSNG